MTIRQWAEKYCFENGMFEKDAKAVVEMAIADKENEAMERRWDEPIDGYPPQLLAVLTMSINQAAIKHIEENCPQAWYKAMFEPQTT